MGEAASGLPVLDRTSLSEIASLCARSIPDPPSVTELGDALFAPDQPAIVRGDPGVAVVATVPGDAGAHVRLLVVDPGHRGQGRGHALLRAAGHDARDVEAASLTIGADPPYFLWPGIPSTATDLLCLVERHHYRRVGAHFDMEIDLTVLPDDPGDARIASPRDRDEVAGWAASHWPHWRSEVLRALDKGNLVVDCDAEGISAFCAFEVNRAGLLGPVAVRPDLLGKGAGRAALIGALHELRRRGREQITVVWVGPVVPYARLGGRVSNVYFVYRRELA